ncbi:MAG: response regulator [Lachnospiraceae bacterium]|nr:response regulator [Lachnospiraceae bacterium]
MTQTKIEAESSKKNIYIMERDVFNILTTILAGLCVYAGVIYYVFLHSRDIRIFANLFICFCICTAVHILNKRNLNLRSLTIFMVMYIELVLMPVFLQYGVQNASSTPIWFAGSIIGIILILEVKDIWWVFLIALYWNTYLYFKNYIWPLYSTEVPDRVSYFFGYAFSFASIALALSYVLIRIERNITKVETEIDKSHEIEKNAGLAKARFLANMTHEIRTPMNSIIGLTELALKEDMNDNIRNEMTVIKNAAYDLLEIIDDVLMYSKLDSGKLRLVDVDFCFDEILRQVLDTLCADTKGKDLKVRVKLDHNIPKVLRGDDMRIKQVFMRLVFISLSLTQNGRLMINIECKRNEDDTKAHFDCAILDTGCGLSEYDIDAIYEAYETYNSKQNSNLKGISLKFIICKKIIELMGGVMDVRSIEGVGLESSFCFDCDITDASPMIAPVEGEKKNVLIYIDDMRELENWKLLMEGFKIRADYADSEYAFGKSIQKKYYNYIFVPAEVYESIENVLTTYNCEEKTYVVTGIENFYGDYDKCRIIRHPVSSLNIGDVLNDKWSVTEYIKKNESVDLDISKAKILVVDDNGVNLKVATGLFGAYNNKIDTAKSGEEALSKLNDNVYDIVFMDMVMPGLSGEETLNKMRASDKKETREVPVIALTANIGGNIREEIIDKGFKEYIAKPIKPRYLSNILINLLPPELIKTKASAKTVAKAETKAKPETQENFNVLKDDEDFKTFVKAVKEMDLDALRSSLNGLSKKTFSPHDSDLIKEACDAFSLYDFRRLRAVMDEVK